MKLLFLIVFMVFKNSYAETNQPLFINTVPEQNKITMPETGNVYYQGQSIRPFSDDRVINQPKQKIESIQKNGQVHFCTEDRGVTICNQ